MRARAMTRWTFVLAPALATAACHRPGATASDAAGPLPEPVDAAAPADAAPIDAASTSMVDAGALPAFATRPKQEGPFAVILDGDCEDVDVDLGATATYVHVGQRIWTMTTDGQLGDERVGPEKIDVVAEVAGAFPDHAFVIGRDGFRSDTSFHPFRFDAAKSAWEPLLAEEVDPNGNSALVNMTARAFVDGGLVFAATVTREKQQPDGGWVTDRKSRLVGSGATAPALSPDHAKIVMLKGFPTGEWFGVAAVGESEKLELRWIKPGMALHELPLDDQSQQAELTAYAPDDVYLANARSEEIIQHFDGHAWKPLPLPKAGDDPPRARFFGRDADGLTWVGMGQKLLLLKADGSVARTVPMKWRSYEIAGVHEGAPYLSARDDADASHVFGWSGDAWQNVQLPKPPFNPTLRYAVNGVHVRGPGDVWLVVDYRYAENTDHFDGSHQGLYDAVLHTQPQGEVLRCGAFEPLHDPAEDGWGNGASHAWAPGADADCKTPLLMVESLPPGEEKATDFARSRKVLRRLPESNRVSGTIVEEVAANGRRYLTAKVPDYATGTKLAKKLRAQLEQTKPELVCADVVPTRTFEDPQPASSDK